MSDKSIPLAHIRRKGLVRILLFDKILTAPDLGDVCDGLRLSGVAGQLLIAIFGVTRADAAVFTNPLGREPSK
jgi:hypothetical protein